MTDYGSDPAVHILGDSAAAVALMRDAAGKAGARILSAMPAEAGVHAGLAPGAALLIELEDETAGAAALLDLAAAEAARDARRAVVSVPLVLLDLAAARMAYPGIELLCAAKEADRLAAITRLREPPDTGVREGRRDSQPFLLPARPDDVCRPSERRRPGRRQPSCAPCSAPAACGTIISAAACSAIRCGICCWT